MPPIKKINKQDVLNCAFEAVIEGGIEALNARSLANRLKCSTQPIFSNFKGMDEIKAEVIKEAENLYQSYLKTDMEAGVYPPYKASGMAYIRFATEQKELFKLLFMRDRSGEEIIEDRKSISPLLHLIMQNLGLDEQNAYLFHLELWLFVHGVATMKATSYLSWDAQFVSCALSDVYNGLKAKFLGKIEE